MNYFHQALLKQIEDILLLELHHLTVVLFIKSKI